MMTFSKDRSLTLLNLNYKSYNLFLLAIRAGGTMYELPKMQSKILNSVSPLFINSIP